MKKPVAVLIAACLTVLAAGPLVLNSSADVFGQMLETTPQNSYDWTQWGVVVTGASDPVSTATMEYTGGPRVPDNQGDGHASPHGGGGLTLRVGSNEESIAQMRNRYLDGALVSGVDIDYSWINTERPGAGTAAAPWVSLVVTGANGVGRHSLTYEPYRNRGGTTPMNDWNRDDAGAPTALWWAGTEPPYFTLQDFAAANPGARVVTDRPGGALAMSAGGGGVGWTNYVGAVDDVTLRRATPDPRTNFDFEPTILTASPGAQQGWTLSPTPATPTATPRAALEAGPETPHFGTGSLELLVGNDGDNRAEAGSPHLAGRSIAGIEALAYGSYVTFRPSDAPCEEAPFLELEAVPANTELGAALTHTLRFHPCDQGVDPAEGEWERWDAKRGTWRWTEPLIAVRAAAPEGVCPDTNPEDPEDPVCKGTLQDYTDTYGEDSAVNSGDSLRVAAGGGAATNPNGVEARWLNFDGNVDFLTLDHADFAGRDYDFEAQAAPPPETTTTTNPNATPPPGNNSTSSTTTVGGSSTTTSTSRPSGPTTTTTTRPADQGAAVTRLHGEDRLATAIAVSQASFGDDQAGAVVVARADDFPDALAATPVAANRRGPLLLSFSDNLDNRVEAEIHRVLTAGGTVHVAGGPVAIGPAVESRLRAAGFNVVRHSGRNRFETATLLAEQVPGASIAFLATGMNFPDALPSGAAAAANSGVVILTQDSTMPPETAAYLNARPNIRRIAVGGQAAGADPGAERVVGDDRFATAVELARKMFPGAPVAGVASGTTFPDSLSGGAHVGTRGGPLLLTAWEPLPQVVRQWLVENRNGLSNVYIYGGPNAVSPNTQNEIFSATATS